MMMCEEERVRKEAQWLVPGDAGKEILMSVCVSLQEV